MDKERYSNRIISGERQVMSTEFIKGLVEDVSSGEQEEKPTKGFLAGYAAGVFLVAVGTFALEGLLFAGVASLLGWPLSFLQGLGIAAVFELVMLRLKNG